MFVKTRKFLPRKCQRCFLIRNHGPIQESWTKGTFLISKKTVVVFKTKTQNFIVSIERGKIQSLPQTSIRYPLSAIPAAKNGYQHDTKLFMKIVHVQPCVHMIKFASIYSLILVVKCVTSRQQRESGGSKPGMAIFTPYPELAKEILF